MCEVPATGYDMEDAMILNKSAVDRGLAHGTIFKTETVNLKDDRGKTQVPVSFEMPSDPLGISADLHCLLQ